MSLTSSSLYCEPTSPNWSHFRHLPDLLTKMAFKIQSISADNLGGIESHSYDAIDDITPENFEGSHYHIRIRSSDEKSITILRINDIGGQEFQKVTVDGFLEQKALLEICQFLGLKKKKPKDVYAKTVFIAYRFDAVGQSFADRLSLFLKLLDFAVVTGKPFSPKSISDKVKSRMDSQDIVIAIHTQGDDNTWITQESVLASVSKPLFILKQRESTFKSGILSDREFIEFSESVDTCFIQLLEGFKELGIEFKET